MEPDRRVRDAPAMPAGLADDWDPHAPDVIGDQLHAYDRMRGSCPVAHSQLLGWSVFRHADVVAVAEDASTYSNRVSANHPAVPNGFDPPEHSAYRRVIERYFEPDDVARLEPSFRTIADELTENLPREQAFDFIDRFALSYALRAQRAWLKWPRYAETALRDWMARSQSATRTGDREKIAEVADEFDRTIRRVISDRRRGPTGADDVTQRLLSERIDGAPLTDDEIVSILRNWTAGELGTMSASVGILADYLARHPRLQQQLRRMPDEMPAAIDEILRIHGPLLSNRRVTTKAVELGGRPLPTGAPISIFWASANRDERVFGDPDAYRPEQNAPHNVLYGRGIHVCPGAPLARLELRVALEALLSGTRQISPIPGVPPDHAIHPAGGWRTLSLWVE